MEILKKIKSQMAEFDQKRKSLVDDLKKDFAPMLKPLFEKYPQIERISWTQYTPYFNDGDECVFGVNNDHDSIELNGKDYYDDNNYKKEEKMFNDVSDFLKEVPESFYKDLFGDHSKIIVNSDGTIDTEEYDHD